MRARPSTRATVVLLLGLLIVARLAGMGLLPLMDTTEARYAEIGRKMAELGDWVTPWYPDGLPFWGKPPLSFWLTAASFKVFGVHEFAARLPHFLCAAGVAVLTWCLAARRTREEALLAVALLGASTLFYVSSGAVMTDAALLLGTMLAMYGFWVGLHGAQAPRQPERWWLFVGIAVGLLAKGPVALLLIGVPLLAWTLVRAEAWAAWRAFPWFSGLAWVAVLVLPWYAMAEVRTPGFLHYFLVGEHWHRFVTPGWKGDLYGTAHRYAPGTIWIFAFGALLPWSVLLPVMAAYRRWKGRAANPAPGDRAWTLYLLLWGLTPLFFFTAARNIIWTYVLPGLPAMSLLGSQWLMKIPLEARHRLVASGLFTSLAGSVIFAVHLESSGRTENKSAKALVAAYAANAVQGTAGQPLIYVGARPHSALFYSGGHARHLDNVSQLAAALPPQGAFVVIGTEELSTLQKMAPIRAHAIGRFGSHELVRLTPSAAEKGKENFR